jgi:hypothetical protein
MTVLSFQWLLTRPRRPAIVIRHLGPARGPVPPEPRTYPDLFFADPVAVEDDSRRMGKCARR